MSLKRGKGNQKNSARSKKALNNDISLPSSAGRDAEPQTFGGGHDIDMTIYRKPTDEIEVSGSVLVPDPLLLDKALLEDRQRVEQTDQGLTRITSAKNSEK